MTYHTITLALILAQCILILKSFSYSKNIYLLTDEICEKLETLTNFKTEQKSHMLTTDSSLEKININVRKILER